MRNHLFAMFFLLPLIVLSQKKTSPGLKNSLTYKDGVQKNILNTVQKIKCFYCNGVGKIKGNETVKCKNCEDWNTEYRKKVGCHVCRDERYITRFGFVDCLNCQNGVADRTPWDCIRRYNIAKNSFDLIDNGDYRYEVMDLPQNGLETIYMYYKNGDAAWAYLNDKKPIMKGKWECNGEKGYIIKWSDGETSNFVLGK